MTTGALTAYMRKSLVDPPRKSLVDIIRSREICTVPSLPKCVNLLNKRTALRLKAKQLLFD